MAVAKEPKRIERRAHPAYRSRPRHNPNIKYRRLNFWTLRRKHGFQPTFGLASPVGGRVKISSNAECYSGPAPVSRPSSAAEASRRSVKLCCTVYQIRASSTTSYSCRYTLPLLLPANRFRDGGASDRPVTGEKLPKRSRGSQHKPSFSHRQIRQDSYPR